MKAVFIAVLLISAISCDNEKLEGEFVEDICAFRIADEHEIRADIEGSDFRTEIDPETEFVNNNSAVLIVHLNGFQHLTLSGFNTDELGYFRLNINSPVAGASYVLSTDDETGLPPNNDNDHELLDNFGYYSFQDDPTDEEDYYNPYVTYDAIEGSGIAEITEFNMEEQYASGTFSFSAKRIKKDPITLLPALDASGNEIIETIEVSCGNFDRIPVTIIDLSEDTSGFTSNEFFAKVDEVDFNPISITTQRNVINDDNVVINIRAYNDVNDLIRIDIPENLTEGTYDMVSLSDGTQLIGMYNPALTASENLTSNPGTITITNINANTGEIDATFSFTGKDPLDIDPAVVEITEGSFSIDYFPNIDIRNVVSATINGELFESNSAEVYTTSFNNITRYNYLSIDEDTNEAIRLIVPSTITLGTYDISDTLITGEEILAYYAFDNEVPPNLIANSGTFTVSQHNEDTGLIEGVFEFTTIDITLDPPVEYIVSSGEFSLFLQ